MVNWDQENKLKLLLAIIEHLNPSSLPWEQLAGKIGPDVSAEAVRGQYKTIKKNFRPFTTTSTSTAASASASKTKTAKKTPTSTTTTGKTRKRKASEAQLNSDDEEPTLIASKSSKVKRESQVDGLSAEVFKAEPVGEDGVDLENDELYSTA